MYEVQLRAYYGTPVNCNQVKRDNKHSSSSLSPSVVIYVDSPRSTFTFCLVCHFLIAWWFDHLQKDGTHLSCSIQYSLDIPDQKCCMDATEKNLVYREFRYINPCSHTNNPCKVLGGVRYFGECGINHAGITRFY
jgi:hypothetical protein